MQHFQYIIMLVISYSLLYHETDTHLVPRNMHREELKREK